MDRLKAAGLHLDKDGNLKILSEENELHSRDTSAKCKLLIADLERISKHVAQTKASLLVFEEEANRLRVVKILARLSARNQQRQQQQEAGD